MILCLLIIERDNLCAFYVYFRIRAAKQGLKRKEVKKELRREVVAKEELPSPSLLLNRTYNANSTHMEE